MSDFSYEEQSERLRALPANEKNKLGGDELRAREPALRTLFDLAKTADAEQKRVMAAIPETGQ
ncbi:MAG: hypothetical protein ACYCPH_03515 [Minisyncoccota bacterium]